MRYSLSCVAAASLLAFTGSGYAASDLGNLPPASAIVTNASLQWVWASPCQGTPSDECGGDDGNEGVLLFDGFHFASVEEWNTWGTLTAFQAAWGGVTCAAPQFSISFDNCDAGDLARGLVWGSPLTDPGAAESPFSETFLVRTVPEPQTYALMLAGLALVGAVARRRAA